MNNQDNNTLPGKVSDAELQRRWQAVRRGMKESSLDFLVMQSNSSIFPGYFKWFTDLPAGGYTSTLIFPREDDMITITHGGWQPAESGPPGKAVRGVKKHISIPLIQSLSYSAAFDAEKTVEEITAYRDCRIGFVGMGFISASFYKYVTGHLSAASFEDATDLVDNIKVIKSEEETGLIRETCKLEDELFEYVLTLVSPGRVDAEIRTEVINRCLQRGVKETNIMVLSGSPDTILRPGGTPRVLQNGDQFYILLETDSPSCYWGELSRVICIGKIPPELEEHFEIAREAQKRTVDMLEPGISPKVLYEANNEFLRNNGCAEETRIFAHGQGYDMVERPGLVAEETMNMQSGMFLAVHPMAVSARAGAGICDNYLMLDSGETERLHKTPQKIFSV